MPKKYLGWWQESAGSVVKGRGVDIRPDGTMIFQLRKTHEIEDLDTCEYKLAEVSDKVYGIKRCHFFTDDPQAPYSYDYFRMQDQKRQYVIDLPGFEYYYSYCKATEDDWNTLNLNDYHDQMMTRLHKCLADGDSSYNELYLPPY